MTKWDEEPRFALWQLRGAYVAGKNSEIDKNNEFESKGILLRKRWLLVMGTWDVLPEVKFIEDSFFRLPPHYNIPGTYKRLFTEDLNEIGFLPRVGESIVIPIHYNGGDDSTFKFIIEDIYYDFDVGIVNCTLSQVRPPNKAINRTEQISFLSQD